MLQATKETFLRRASAAVAAAGHSNLTWRASSSAGASSGTATFSSMAIGTAAADRWVIVATGTLPSGQGTASMTIGGVAATQLAPTLGVQFWGAVVPSGTTATISVTYDSADETAWMGYWTVNMPTSAVVTDTADGGRSGSTVSATGLDIPANGFAVGACICFDNSADQSHSIDASFVEDAEQYISAVGNIAYFKREVTTAQSALSVTSTWTVSTTLYTSIVSFN